MKRLLQRLWRRWLRLLTGEPAPDEPGVPVKIWIVAKNKKRRRYKPRKKIRHAR